MFTVLIFIWNPYKYIVINTIESKHCMIDLIRQRISGNASVIGGNKSSF